MIHFIRIDVDGKVVSISLLLEQSLVDVKAPIADLDFEEIEVTHNICDHLIV